MAQAQANPRRVIVLDPDRAVRGALCGLLGREGHDAKPAATAQAAWDALSAGGVALVLVEPEALGGADACADFLAEVRRRHPEVVSLAIAGYGRIEDAARLTRAGALDYLTKPIAEDEVRHAVAKALRRQALVHDELGRRDRAGGPLVGPLVGPGAVPIVSRDPAMLRLLDTAATAAASEATVLLVGESGTGKSLLGVT